MNQIERRYVISVTMKYQSQIPEMIIKICQDLNISQLLEQIIRAYREKVNEEIFSITNIPLFQLSYKQQQLENADLMSECLGQDGTYELEINYLTNSRNAQELERIKKIDITISNFFTLVKKIEYDGSCKKSNIDKFSPKHNPNLPSVNTEFAKNVAHNPLQYILQLAAKGIIPAVAVAALAASGLGPHYVVFGGLFSLWSASFLIDGISKCN